jgi:uncharacterized RmlC-like cupin family protein
MGNAPAGGFRHDDSPGRSGNKTAGDYLYIPAGMPHLPYNPSSTEACTAVIARTDPNEQEGVLLRPELDGLH